MPEVAKAQADASAEPMHTTRAQLATAVTSEAQSMDSLIKAKNIKLD